MLNLDPFRNFDRGYKVGSTGRKPLEGVMDAFDEEQKAKRKFGYDVALEKEKAKAKAEYMPNAQTGVFSFNPFTGEFNQVSTVPKGSVVRNTLGPENLKERETIKQEAQTIGKQKETGSKLGTAVKRLKIVNQQFNQALPTSKNPLMQRIAGPTAVFGAKTGLNPNAKLLALKRNSRPIGIQLIRAFGEVGNLSETEQKTALDTVQMEGLTDDERMESVKQFAEFALAGANPEALEFMLRDPDVKEIVDGFGINLSGFSSNSTNMSNDIDSARREAKEAITAGAPSDKVAERFKRDFGEEL